MCGSEPDDLIDDLEDVSVLCAGIVDYSSLFAAGSREVMNALSSLFAGFDFLCSRNDGWALESSGLRLLLHAHAMRSALPLFLLLLSSRSLSLWLLSPLSRPSRRSLAPLASL